MGRNNVFPSLEKSSYIKLLTIRHLYHITKNKISNSCNYFIINKHFYIFILKQKQNNSFERIRDKNIK